MRRTCVWVLLTHPYSIWVGVPKLNPVTVAATVAAFPQKVECEAKKKSHTLAPTPTIPVTCLQRTASLSLPYPYPVFSLLLVYPTIPLTCL